MALIRFNGNLLQDVLAGMTVPDVGRAVFYGLSVQCKLIELVAAADLERRLTALEQRLVQQPERSRPWAG